MQKLMGLMRRCIEDYRMISPNDKIAVGVSGGKDSITMLYLLNQIRNYYPNSFQLFAYTVDLGFEGMSFDPISDFCRNENIPYRVIHSEISKIIFDYRKESNPCSLCSKMRRGALVQAISADGISKLALGHHYDDAVETFFMSLFYEGRISCFQPVTYLDRTGITQIRPMLYLQEKTIEHFAQSNSFPVVQNRCPADKNTKREDIKQLVYSLAARYPNLKEYVFGAMQRLPLPEWDIKPHQRISNK